MQHNRQSMQCNGRNRRKAADVTDAIATMDAMTDVTSDRSIHTPFIINI